MKWTDEHNSIRETAAKFVDNEINPYVDQWEAEGIFPAHELFKKLGDLGMLGINKPEKYGGLGLGEPIIFPIPMAHWDPSRLGLGNRYKRSVRFQEQLNFLVPVFISI